MLVKNKGVGRRAWSILRLVLLWARKGGMFKRRLLVDLRLFGRSGRGRDRIRSMERELSFEKTPMVHVKMHRPHSLRFVMPRLPCINPRTDYDYDFDLDSEDYCSDVGNVGYDDDDGRISCLENHLEDGPTPRALREVEAAEGIDSKADEFIAKFYQQMKLQRQISYLEYFETQDRSNF